MNRLGEKDVIRALLAAGHEPAVSVFDQGTETAEAAARELDVDVSRIIKSMVFTVDGAPVLALLPGDTRADTKAIKKLLKAKKVRLADPDKVLQWTGYPVGAVPPVGHASPLPVLLDLSIAGGGKIYPAAGEMNNLFETTLEKLLGMTGGTLCAISRPREGG
ncbi:MAG: YbaK/EbsC family protein [bacterium]|nr:MAG: YbaK/EbsC family protein [bacterium]